MLWGVDSYSPWIEKLPDVGSCGICQTADGYLHRGRHIEGDTRAITASLLSNVCGASVTFPLDALYAVMKIFSKLYHEL